MNHTLLKGILALAGLSLLACQNKEMESPDSAFVAPNDYVKFYAETEMSDSADTKVYADHNLKVLWNEGDMISIFNQFTYNWPYYFEGEDGDNSGWFSQEYIDAFITGNEIPGIYAVYPYDESTRISNQSVISVNLPEVQEYRPDSFGRGANLMVSATEDNYLRFKNVGGYLSVKLYGEGVAVKEITLSGNAGEILAGEATVVMPVGGLPEVTMSSNGATQVCLVCPEPVTLGATAEDYTEFWFVIPPTTFEEGITVTVYDAGFGVFEKSSETPITVTRSNITRLSPVEAEMSAPVQPENEIWYTTADGSALQGRFNANAFAVSLVSDTYEDGKGILTFDGPVTTIGRTAFENSETRYLITSISLPSSVEAIESRAFRNLRVMESINIPEGVTFIGDRAFQRCHALASISIPDSVTEIGYGAFADCRSLSSFGSRFASEDGRCLIVDGVLNSFAPAGLSGEYVVPEGVVTLGRSVFEDLQDIQQIILPSSLEVIERYAFDYSSVQAVVLPEGLRVIESYAFESTGLRFVNIPSTVESIGEAAFCSCYNLQGFSGKYATEDGWALIVDGSLIAFANNSGISEYVVPEGVTALGMNAFRNFNLTSLVLPSTLESMNNYAICWSDGLLSVTFLSSVPPKIDTYSIEGCDNVTIYVPAESLEAYQTAFEGSQYADRIREIETGWEPSDDWAVIGSISSLNTAWDADFAMDKKGNIYVRRNLYLQSGDEFKIRYQGSWNTNRGGDFLKLGYGFEAFQDGVNIMPGLEGYYDVYYNAELEMLAVCRSGDPVNWTPYVPPITRITIDGSFNDWAALPADIYSQAVCDPDASRTALTLAKVYADPDYVYVYFEWDPEQITHEPDVEHVPFHCYINTDGDTSTGGWADMFSDACTDILLEGFIYPDGWGVGSYDSDNAFAWSGETNGYGWSWSDVYGYGGICYGAGVEGKYEFAIDRSKFTVFGYPIADVFSIGFEIQQAWLPVGVLPNAAATAENPNCIAPLLTVTTIK